MTLKWRKTEHIVRHYEASVPGVGTYCIAARSKYSRYWSVSFKGRALFEPPRSATKPAFTTERGLGNLRGQAVARAAAQLWEEQRLEVMEQLAATGERRWNQ